MKTIKKSGKYIVTAALLMSSWIAASDVRAEGCGDHDTSLAGSYRGKELKGGTKYDLLVRSVEGRTTSYLAVLMTKDETKVNLYILDAVTEATYSMTPLTTTADGNIGEVNSNPSLVLSRMSEGTGEECSVDLMIAGAQSSNSAADSGAIRFTHHTSVQWEDYTPGIYKISGNRHAGNFGPIGKDSREATVFLTAPSSGYFVLRERISGFFTLKPNSYTDTGVTTATAPKGIGLFVSRPELLGRRTQFLLVNPSNAGDVTELKRRVNQ